MSHSTMKIKSLLPKPFVFVLMPFLSEFDDVYELGITLACNEADAYCERVDKQIFTESILDRVINQIAKADIVVSDMSGQNPNVFYETGYAHALGKTVILLTKNVADIPFDLKQYPHIVYGNRLVDLKAELTTRLKFFIAHPTTRRLSGIWSLEFYQSGRMASDGDEIRGQVTHAGNLSLVFDLYNPGPKRFVGQNCSVAMIGDRLVREVNINDRSVELPDGGFLSPLPSFPNIFPGGWSTVRFDLKPWERHFGDGEVIPLTLRLLSDAAPRDLRFTVRAERPAEYG
jgi:hypothetical protein